MASRAGHTSTAKPGRVRLPATIYLVYEAAPFFAYSALYMIFLLIPHLLAWMGALPVGQERMSVVTSVEAGLTMALLPLVLVGGIPEHTLMEFWRFAPKAQADTSGIGVSRFRQSLAEFYHRYRQLNMTVLMGLSFVAMWAFFTALGLGFMDSWLALPSLNQTLFFFLSGLVVYWLLGWGLFNCMFCLSLGSPAEATRAVTCSIAITLLVGVPLSLWGNYAYAALAFICGALTFAVVSQWATRKLLASSDYHYISSL